LLKSTVSYLSSFWLKRQCLNGPVSALATLLDLVVPSTAA
jgi:hypothetical protein